MGGEGAGGEKREEMGEKWVGEERNGKRGIGEGRRGNGEREERKREGVSTWKGGFWRA